MTKSYINYLASLNATCNMIIYLVNALKTSKLEHIDDHISNVDQMARRLADAKRDLLYFKNTGQAPGTPPSDTPPRPPGLKLV